MRINLKLSQQGLILVGVPIGLMLLFLVALFLLLLRVEKQAADADRSKTIISKAESLVKQYYDAGSQLMIYKYTKSDLLKARFENQLNDSEKCFVDLHELLKDDTDELMMLAELKVSAERGMGLMRAFERRLQEVDNIPGIEATLMYKEFEKAGTDFTAKLHELVEHETEKHKTNSADEQNGRAALKMCIIGGAVSAIVLGTTLALFFTSNTTSRLALLMDNTKRLSRKQDLLPLLEGEDEIAQLDQTFHKMAFDLAEATRKERAILDNAVDVICSINADGKFTAANPASLQTWGYAPEKLVGLPYSHLIAREDCAKFGEAIEQIKRDKAPITIENRIVNQGQEFVHVLWSLRWSEEERSLFCVAHDVSDRKRVEQLKQEFLAVISHELRTPLTSLQATLTLLGTGAYGELNGNGERRVRSAESGIGRLIMMINDLLDMEKMEAGKLSMTYADIDLADVISRSIDAIQGFSEEQGVTVEAHTRPVTVLADAERLVQVMVNLLSNAIKYSEDGFAVQIELVDKKEFCEVQIIDHGVGIPAGYEEKIFAKYEQAPVASGAKKRKGTGLGLPICKAIVEQHGGDIGVRPTAGGGSTFWYTIPRVGA